MEKCDNCNQEGENFETGVSFAGSVRAWESGGKQFVSTSVSEERFEYQICEECLTEWDYDDLEDQASLISKGFLISGVVLLLLGAYINWEKKQMLFIMGAGALIFSFLFSPKKKKKHKLNPDGIACGISGKAYKEGKLRLTGSGRLLMTGDIYFFTPSEKNSIAMNSTRFGPDETRLEQMLREKRAKEGPVHLVGGLTNDKEGGFMKFQRKMNENDYLEEE